MLNHLEMKKYSQRLAGSYPRFGIPGKRNILPEILFSTTVMTVISWTQLQQLCTPSVGVVALALAQCAALGSS